jgi:uncharacterized protein (DUF1684 family)
MSDLNAFRKSKDAFFSSHHQSPLTANQKKNFVGLKYFEENPQLRIEVSVEEYAHKDQIEIQTSTGDTQNYLRYGRFEFPIDGKKGALTIYENDNGYFLPFVDSLAVSETYPAGRYLEPEYIGNGKFHIDFNLAYNPYCAYNPSWSCPLTPFENRLKVPIRAGEKIFESHK